MPKLTKADREKRLLAAENRRIRRFMREVGIPMNIERVREIEKDVREKRMAREIFEQAAHLADLCEAVQENNHGAANTGGAAQVATAVRAYGDIFFGRHKGRGTLGESIDNGGR